MNQDKLNQIFFSTDNFNLLYQLIKENVYSRVGGNINLESIDFENQSRSLLSQIMTQSYYDSETEKNIKSLNKSVLTNTITKLNKTIQQQLSPPPQHYNHPKENTEQMGGSSLIPPSRGNGMQQPRDMELSNRKNLPNFVDMRPPQQNDVNSKKETDKLYMRLSQERQIHQDSQQPPLPPQFRADDTENVNNTDVMGRFEMLKKQQEEMSTVVQPPPFATQQQQSQTTSLPPPINTNISNDYTKSLENFNQISKNMQTTREKEFQMYQETMTSREDEFKSQMTKKPDELSLKQEENKNSWEKDVNGNLSFERNLQDEVFRKNADPINRDARNFQMDTKIHDELQQHNDKRLGVQQTDFLIERSGKFVTELIYLEISSGDRDFNKPTSSENRFNFSVNFDSEGNTYKQMPLFQNNPTLPSDETQANMGHRGDDNPLYDPEKPLGEIVGYENIRNFSMVNAGVPVSIKNIVCVKLNYVMIYYPSSTTYNYYNYLNNNPTSDYPYLLLQVPELMNTYKSTNAIINSSHSKLLLDKNWLYTNQSSGMLMYRPLNGEQFVYQIPIASFNKLSFKLLTPAGDLLSTMDDWATISQVVFDSTGHIIILLLSKYVLKSMFGVSQHLYIQNLEIYSSFTDSEMLGHIQKSSGHKIVNCFRSDNDTSLTKELFVNMILIDYPSHIDQSTGEIVYYDFPSSQYQGYGVVVNSSIQSQLSFTVTVKKDDMFDIGSLIV